MPLFLQRMLDRLTGLAATTDPREALRPLWHQCVGLSRDPRWYRELGVADSMEGRFDMLSLVMAMAMLRLEQVEGAHGEPALLTELFVEDMEGQLRESGIGDPTVGKHVGNMVSALGGRLGALREAGADAAALEAIVARNVTMADETKVAELAREVGQLAAHIGGLQDDALLAGRIAP